MDTISSTILCYASSLEPAILGVKEIFSCLYSLLFLRGSLENISNVAAATLPESKASIKASSSIIQPLF